MECGSAVDHVVPRPDRVVHARPVELETAKILLIHSVHELVEGIGDDDVLGTVTNEPADVPLVAEGQHCGEAEPVLAAEGGHVRRA